MPNKTLLFFTATFPYGKGEAFIEAEYPFLVNQFTKILIITEAPVIEDIRTVNANTIVRSFKPTSNLFNKFKALLSFNWKEFFAELKANSNRVSAISIFRVCFNTHHRGLSYKLFLKKLVHDEKLDFNEVVFYSYWLNHVAYGLCMFKNEYPAAKIVARAHGWDVYFERHQPPYLPFRYFMLNALNVCFSISNDGKMYLEKFVKKNSCVKLSRLGTKKLKEQQQETNADFSIVSCSSIIPLKRVHLIAEALSLISNSRISWKHFGGGELLQEVKQKAERLLSNTAVKFEFLGQTSNVELHCFYASNKVDLFVNVSETEGIPVSIMEALSYAVPAIAPNVGGIKEIVNESNGLLLSSNSTAREVADAILYFMNIPASKMNEYRNNAFLFWSENFNAEKNFLNFVTLLNKL